MNKYHNIKTEIGGVKYDSKAEMLYALQLNELQKQGLISGYERQKKIVLQEGFRDRHGKKVRAITYVADFIVHWLPNGTQIVDVKSSFTATLPSFRLKWRLLQWKYKDDTTVELTIVEV